MSEYRMGTKCVQAGYTPGNGEPRQVPIIHFYTMGRTDNIRKIARNVF